VAKQSITVELDDETVRSLAVLGEPIAVLAHLAHSAADGVRRPAHPQRRHTDESLRVERDKTDTGVAEKRKTDEAEADEVVRIARQRADQVVQTARREASERRPQWTATEADSERARTVLENERSSADALLAHERVERRRDQAEFQTAEREATDDGLTGERAQSDTVLADQREANARMVSATIRAQELTEEAEEAQRRSSAALEEREEQFRRLVESVGDYAIFMLDPNGIITTWNLGAERIKGYKADEIIGQHFSRFYAEEDVRAGTCERELEVATRVGRFEDEGWRIRKDGSRFWANVVITAIRESPGGKLRGLAKVTRDLTSRKAAEEEKIELAKSQERESDLREVAEFREMFIGILGHDLRNPLGSIVMSAGLLLQRGHLDEQDARIVARIVNGSQRMTRMIAQLLDLTRARLGGGLPIQPEPTDLRDVCRNVVDEFEATIDLEVLGDVTGTWDPDRLAEALSNLAGNAIEYAIPGTAMVVKAQADGADVVVEIRNQGRPIPAEVLPFIFEPFRRAQQGEKSKAGNLGLGLYIARQIVLSHGGTLDAHSVDGTTTFVMRLPRGAASSKTAQ
jgi:PAS domain S-box-containing protein